MEMNLKNPVSGNREEELGILSSSVNPVRLKNNPVELNINVIRSIYELMVLESQ